MARFAPVGAALLAAFAAWLSQGTIGFAAPDGPRLAVLPVSVAALLVALTAAMAVIGFWRAGVSLLPVVLLAFVLLPWLPLPVPVAFLLWAAPVAWFVWVAVLLLMLAALPRPKLVTLSSHPTVAGAIALLLFSLAAWRAAPMIPGGDEPHYLVITQSILLDGDLTIEDVHRRGDYRAYFSGDLAPHVQRRGRDGQIYSVHAPGLPVFVAPAFAVGGYRAVVMLLLFVAACGSALAWHLAWTATRRADAAWFGWAAVTLPVTAVFQSFTVYPDGPGGVLALTGLWAILRAEEEAKTGSTRAMPWLWHGAALSLLPWFHSRFAVLAVSFGALILLRLPTSPNPAAKAVAFLSVPAVSAILWVGFFIAVYGTPDPSAPYAAGELGSMLFVPGGLAGLLFDQRFGLLAYAPVLACAFLGVGFMVARRGWRRFGLELLFVVVPYLLTVTHFAMWWGGWSPPARFFAPILPLFVLPAAVAWTMAAGRAARLLASSSLVLTSVASVIVVVVDRGRLAFNTREAPALWLEWLGRLADLTAAVPMWTRETDVPLFRGIAIWIAMAIAAWAVLRVADRSARFRDRTVFSTLTVLALALAVMAASSIAWAFTPPSGRTVVASQLELLDAVSSQRVVAVQLDPPSRLAVRDVPGRLRLELTRRPGGRPGGRDTAAMFALPPLPAGRYRLRVNGDNVRGWLMIGIARESRDPFALRTVQLPVDAIDLYFPLPVRALVVRGDEDAWRAVRGVVVEPLAIAGPADRLTGDLARRAVRYGGSTVYFLDDRAFPEPEAFWVGGARSTAIVIQPDVVRASATIRLRNAPVENRVTLVAGTWRRELRLSAGEEQQLEVPLDAALGGALVRIESAAGFRPAEQDPASRDHRFLGVWIRVAAPVP